VEVEEIIVTKQIETNPYILTSEDEPVFQVLRKIGKEFEYSFHKPNGCIYSQGSRQTPISGGKSSIQFKIVRYTSAIFGKKSINEPS
jgi:hypothetical protein